MSQQQSTVMLSLDTSIASPLLVHKYVRQSNALKFYLHKRDELLNDPTTSCIPLEFMKDIQVLCKHSNNLETHLLTRDEEFIMFFLRNRKENIYELMSSIHDDLKCKESFIEKAIMTNAKCFPTLCKELLPRCDRNNFRSSTCSLDEIESDLEKERLEKYIKLNPKILRYFSRELNEFSNGRELIKEWLKRDVNIYSYFRDDRELTLFAIDCNPYMALQQSSDQFKDDEEIVLKAISKNKNALQFASDSIIGKVLNQKKLMEYSPQDVRELVMDGIKTKPFLFNYLAESDKTNQEFVLQLISKTPKVGQLIPDSLKQDKEFQTKWVRYDINVFYQCTDLQLRATREYLLNSRYSYKFVLSSTPPHLKDDKDFVIQCLEINPEGFENINDRLKDDEDVVMSSLHHKSNSFHYVSNRLKDDREFVLKCMNIAPYIYQDISNRLKLDKEIVIKHVKGKLDVRVDPSLLTDEDFALDLIEINERVVYNVIHANLDISYEFIKRSIERNGNCLQIWESYKKITETEQIDELSELAAISSGYVLSENTNKVSPSYGFRSVSTTITYEDRSILDEWRRKRLEKFYDGLYIDESSPLFIKAEFVSKHERDRYHSLNQKESRRNMKRK